MFKSTKEIEIKPRRCTGTYRIFKDHKYQDIEFEGNFHQWAPDYEEFDSGPGNY